MANLTLSIEDEVLKRARIRALEAGTSVNAVVREYLTEFAGADQARQAVLGFLEITERSGAGSDARGRTWTRDELYEDRVGRFSRER